MVVRNKSKKQKRTSKSSIPIPMHIKSIIICAIFLLSIQALLISTVYFHLNDRVETSVLNAENVLLNAENSVLNAISNTSVVNVEKKILSTLHLIPQTPLKKGLNFTSKRDMYRNLYMAGQRGEIDLITMVKLATENDNINEVLNDSNATTDHLPTQDEIKEMYGNDVIFEGSDTCKRFRDTKPLHKRIIAPAGLFNTGTHLLYYLMKRNCRFAHFNQVNFQVPW